MIKNVYYKELVHVYRKVLVYFYFFLTMHRFGIGITSLFPKGVRSPRSLHGFDYLGMFKGGF